MIKELSDIRKRILELSKAFGNYDNLNCREYPHVSEALRHTSDELVECFHLIPTSYWLRHSSRSEKKEYFSSDYLRAWLKIHSLWLFIINFNEKTPIVEYYIEIMKLCGDLYSIVYSMDKFAYAVINKAGKEKLRMSYDKKEFIRYIRDRLDEVIDSIEGTVENDTTCEFETKCLYEHLIMQCNNTKSFILLVIMREWSKEELFRIYYLTYNSILSIKLLIEHEKDTFGYYGYTELDDLLVDCLQTISGQMFFTE